MVRIAIASIVATAVAGSAFAAHTVEMRKIDTGLGRQVRLTHVGDSDNVFAGEIIHEFRNGQGMGAQFSDITMPTYCTEVTQHITNNFAIYTVTDDISTMPAPPMGADKADAISDMFATLLGLHEDNAMTNDWAAAFQIAVWDVVYDYDAGAGRDSLDVEAGDIQVHRTDGSTLSAGLLTKIGTFWDSIGVAESPLTVIGFHSDSYQDQIVPAPGTLALASAGLLLIGRRRKA